jgi:DnaJ-class molecular chaperone
MTLFLLELAVAFVVGRIILRRYVQKRLCPKCEGLGTYMDHLDRKRPCVECHMRGVKPN